MYSFRFSKDDYLHIRLPLTFRGGRFRILLLCDPHGGDGGNPQVFDAMEAVVGGTEPDLVLLGGDMSGCEIGCANIPQLQKYLDALLLPMEKRGIPWAHVYGNHDDNLGIPNSEAQTVYESYPHCVSQRGPSDIHGVGNYVLPITDESGRPAFNVFCLDSHDGNRRFCETFGLPPQTRISLSQHAGMGHGSDSPYFDQIMWYYNTSEAVEETFGRRIPAMLFQHIPLPEYNLIPRNPSDCCMRGNMREDICSNELNCGLFSALLQRGDVKAVFCGHEHINDFTGVYCGVTLGYCAGINYDAGSHDDLRGGRVVELTEDGGNVKLDTYTVKLRQFVGTSGDDRGR